MTDFPVFLTGLDFSYIPGKPHARGAPSQLLSLSASSRLQPAGYYRNAIERSSYKITDKNSLERFTDPVLQSYIEPLRSIIGGKKRFFDIGGYGLATGATPLLSRDEIENVLFSQSTFGKEVPSSGKGELSGTISHGRIQQFYRNQASFLSEIVDLGKSMITGSSNPGTLTTIEKMVKTHDYILAHFPETPPYPYSDIQFIKRVVVSAGHYLSVIKRIQTR
jgi:hypothetical protein